MRLLILTQKVDEHDDVLGFMHGWIAEFAQQCEKLTVICLQKKNYNLPANVNVLSLGKETGRSRLKYIIRFYKYIWQERHNYDYVFVHMNQKYVILGGLPWRFLGKKIGLWYAHGYTPASLRLAEKLTQVIITSTKSGCRLASNKIKIIGQGIDTSKFAPTSRPQNNIFKIITIGRISPIKDYETLIKAAEILARKKLIFKIDIIGGAGLREQEEYLENLKRIVREKKLDEVISFIGPVPNKYILKNLVVADLFVNTSRTGSLDKAILEAMSAGLPALTCNEALGEVLGNYQDKLMYPAGDAQVLADKIRMIIKMETEVRIALGKNLRNIVKQDHDLAGFINKIIKILKGL